MANIGMICEQGDMGLHFDPLSEKEQKVLKEQQEDRNKKDDNTYNHPKKK